MGYHSSKHRSWAWNSIFCLLPLLYALPHSCHPPSVLLCGPPQPIRTKPEEPAPLLPSRFQGYQQAFRALLNLTWHLLSTSKCHFSSAQSPLQDCSSLAQPQTSPTQPQPGLHASTSLGLQSSCPCLWPPPRTGDILRTGAGAVHSACPCIPTLQADVPFCGPFKFIETWHSPVPMINCFLKLLTSS